MKLEDFLQELRGFVCHAIHFNHICVEAACGAYDGEDIYSECNLAICEFFNERDGKVHIPLTNDELKDLSKKLNQHLRGVLANGACVSISPDYMRSDVEERLSSATARAAKAAMLPYVPLNISSGTQVCAIEMESKISVPENRRKHSAYTLDDFRDGNTFAEAEVLFETFAEGEANDDFDDVLYSFLETLSQNEKEAIKSIMDGQKLGEVRREFGLPEKWVRSLRTRFKRFLEAA